MTQKFKKLLLTGLTLIFAYSAYSQENVANTEWMNYIEELGEADDADQNALEQLFDDLSQITEQPFNLKTATKADLERLPFLTPIQIENLLYYVYKFGIKDIHELKNVEDLDMQTIIYILPFVRIGEDETAAPLRPNNMLRYGRHDLMLRTDRTLQQKAGYAPPADEEEAAKPNKHYLGPPYYMSVRYGYRYRDIQAGFAAEKDAGEPLWNEARKGFDHFAFNINIKNRGIVEDLHFGDYRLSFGQGLAVNTNFAMGKTTFTTNIGQMNEGIRRHATTSESGYFRGAATSLRFSNLQLTLFGSHRRQDANADSATVFTIKTDGYNRLPSDMEKRRTATISAAGGHLRWRTESINLGLTAIGYGFGGKRLDPEPRPYNLFYQRGEHFFNASVNYGFQGKHFVFQGETAIDGNGKTATVNNLLLNPVSNIDWTLSWRSYARDYNAFFARAFSESSTVQNENGIYSGLRFHPVARLELSAYVDLFRFPWMKYGINAPSSGADGLMQLIFRPVGKWEFQARYKYKQKEKNTVQTDGNETFILPYEQHRWRFRTLFRPAQTIEASTQMDCNIYRFQDQQQAGWSLTETLTWTPDASPMRISGCIGYFHTDDWNTRVSLYEKNVLYAFSFPTYYGQGLRLYSVVRWKISKRLTAYFKIGNTRYFDRDTVGSDLEAIDGSDKTDVSLLLKMTL